MTPAPAKGLPLVQTELGPDVPLTPGRGNFPDHRFVGRHGAAGKVELQNLPHDFGQFDETLVRDLVYETKAHRPQNGGRRVGGRGGRALATVVTKGKGKEMVIGHMALPAQPRGRIGALCLEWLRWLGGPSRYGAAR